MSTSPQGDCITVETGQFRQSQPCLNGEQQQSVVAAPHPRCGIRRYKERFDFRSRQELHLTFVVSLAWYGKHPLDLSTICGFLEGDELKEGADCGQAEIARTNADRPAFLDVLQERADQGCIEIAQVKIGRRYIALGVRELQQ